MRALSAPRIRATHARNAAMHSSYGAMRSMKPLSRGLTHSAAVRRQPQDVDKNLFFGGNLDIDAGRFEQIDHLHKKKFGKGTKENPKEPPKSVFSQIVGAWRSRRAASAMQSSMRKLARSRTKERPLYEQEFFARPESQPDYIERQSGRVSDSMDPRLLLQINSELRGAHRNWTRQMDSMYNKGVEATQSTVDHYLKNATALVEYDETQDLPLIQRVAIKKKKPRHSLEDDVLSLDILPRTRSFRSPDDEREQVRIAPRRGLQRSKTKEAMKKIGDSFSAFEDKIEHKLGYDSLDVSQFPSRQDPNVDRVYGDEVQKMQEAQMAQDAHNSRNSRTPPSPQHMPPSSPHTPPSSPHTPPSSPYTPPSSKPPPGSTRSFSMCPITHSAPPLVLSSRYIPGRAPVERFYDVPQHLPSARVNGLPNPALRWRPAAPTSLRGDISVYQGLSKARLTTLVVLTSMGGYAMCPADPASTQETIAALSSVMGSWTPQAVAPHDAYHNAQSMALSVLAPATIGTALCSWAAATFNQVIEAPYDAQMPRTRNRPLPRFAVTPLAASIFGGVSGIFGIATLASVSPIAACLGLANIVLYCPIYTILKRHTVYNTWVGSVVGALPPLIGWAACAQSVNPLTQPGAYALFALMFFWQFPHFNSLAHTLRDSYAASGYRMLSVVNPRKNARVSLRYAVAMIPLSFMFPALNLTFPVFPYLAALPNGLLAWGAYRFWRHRSQREARFLFFASLIHLPIVFTLAMLCKRDIDWWGIITGAPSGDADDTGDGLLDESVPDSRPRPRAPADSNAGDGDVVVPQYPERLV